MPCEDWIRSLGEEHRSVFAHGVAAVVFSSISAILAAIDSATCLYLSKVTFRVFFLLFFAVQAVGLSLVVSYFAGPTRTCENWTIVGVPANCTEYGAAISPCNVSNRVVIAVCFQALFLVVWLVLACMGEARRDMLCFNAAASCADAHCRDSWCCADERHTVDKVRLLEEAITQTKKEPKKHSGYGGYTVVPIDKGN